MNFTPNLNFGSLESFSLNSFNLHEPKQSSKIKVKCIKNQQAESFCVNPKCKINQVFICKNQICECQQTHKTCRKYKIQSMITLLNQKNLDSQQIRALTSQKFTTIIDKISNIQDKISTNLKKRLTHINKSDLQKQFLKQVQSQIQNASSIFTGEKLSSLCANFGNKQNQKSDNNNQKMESFSRQLIQKISKFEQSILKQINLFGRELQNLMEVFSPCQTLISINSLVDYKLLNSNIIQSQNQFERLIKFFDKKIISIRLAFQASENQFSMQQYFSTCGKLENTLIICQTTKGKKIGGFSPLSHQNDNEHWGSFVADPSESSFVFSLSENDIFKLSDKNKAIHRWPKRSCICFGGCAFFIVDKANEKNENQTFLGESFYYNKKYTNSSYSYYDLNGNDNYKFTAKQWEVIQLYFE